MYKIQRIKMHGETV